MEAIMALRLYISILILFQGIPSENSSGRGRERIESIVYRGERGEGGRSRSRLVVSIN
jgi:hypothetical protein